MNYFFRWKKKLVVSIIVANILLLLFHVGMLLNMHGGVEALFSLFYGLLAGPNRVVNLIFPTDSIWDKEPIYIYRFSTYFYSLVAYTILIYASLVLLKGKSKANDQITGDR